VEPGTPGIIDGVVVEVHRRHAHGVERHILAVRDVVAVERPVIAASARAGRLPRATYRCYSSPACGWAAHARAARAAYTSAPVEERESSRESARASSRDGGSMAGARARL
jgi:hypothetical protein